MLCKLDRKTLSPIWINPDHVVSMIATATGGTQLTLVSRNGDKNTTVTVQGTPSQVAVLLEGAAE